MSFRNFGYRLNKPFSINIKVGGKCVEGKRIYVEKKKDLCEAQKWLYELKEYLE